MFVEQVCVFVEFECDLIVNVVNFFVFVYYLFDCLNWVGFYFFDGIEFVVGLFQGKFVCVWIVFGKGVCGMVVQICEM